MEQLLCRLIYAVFWINLLQSGNNHLVTVALENGSECKITMLGDEYAGMINITLSGRICQRWELEEPHGHIHTYLTSEENYCRNPDQSPQGPWCYTTDPAKRWEYCNVPFCETTVPSTETTAPSTVTPEPSTETTEPSTVNPEQGSECKITMLGEEYAGMIHITRSGRICQRWALEEPHGHIHTYLTSEENYCRNPDQSPEGPWCYTTDPAKRWEYCNVPFCETTVPSTETTAPSTVTPEPSTETTEPSTVTPEPSTETTAPTSGAPAPTTTSNSNVVESSSVGNPPKSEGTTTIGSAPSAIIINLLFFFFTFLYGF